ncbi:MAG: nucleotidyltransferase family protein [Vicinamibacterales bacterium]
MPDARPWSSDVELLLACATRRLDPAARARADHALAAGADWTTVRTLASAHGLLPLLHAHAAGGALVVPPGVLAALRDDAARVARRNLQLCAELAAIATACAAQGIPLVPLKGPLLAESLYGSVALRQYRDLDVLVRRGDLRRFAALLRDRGYDVDRIPSSELVLDNSYHLLARAPRRGGLLVEVHYSLVAHRTGHRQDYESLEPVLETRRFMGQDVQAVPREEELVYLCEHGAKHAWTRLDWIATIAERLREPSLDWDRVDHYATRVGARRRVAAALWLAARLWDDVAVPAAFHWHGSAFVNRLILRRLHREPTRILAFPLERLRYLLWTDTGSAARLRRCWMTFVVPAPYDLDAMPSAAARSPLRVLARPLQLLSRWWGGQRAEVARRPPRDRA